MTPSERRKKKRQAQKARAKTAIQTTTTAIGAPITETPAELSTLEARALLPPQPSSSSEAPLDSTATEENKIERKTPAPQAPGSVARVLEALSAPAKIEDVATSSSSTTAATIAQASVSSSGTEEKEVKPVRSKDDLLAVLSATHPDNRCQPLMSFLYDFLSRFYRYQYEDPAPTEESYTILNAQYNLLLRDLFSGLLTITPEDLGNSDTDWINKLATQINALSRKEMPIAIKIARQVKKIYKSLYEGLTTLIPKLSDVSRRRKAIIRKETKSFIANADCKADYDEGRDINRPHNITFIGSGQDILRNSEEYIYGYDEAVKHPTCRHSILPYSLSLHYSESIAENKLVGHAFCPERRWVAKGRERGSDKKNQAFIAGVIDANRPVLCWTPLQCIRAEGGYLIQELFWLIENGYTFIPSSTYPELVWAIPPTTPKIDRRIPIDADERVMQLKVSIMALKLDIDHPELRERIQNTTEDLAAKDEKELCSKTQLLALAKKSKQKNSALNESELKLLQDKNVFLFVRIDALTAEIQSLMANRIADVTIASSSTLPTPAKAPLELPMDSPTRANPGGNATSSGRHAATPAAPPSSAKKSR